VLGFLLQHTICTARGSMPPQMPLYVTCWQTGHVQEAGRLGIPRTRNSLCGCETDCCAIGQYANRMERASPVTSSSCAIFQRLTCNRERPCIARTASIHSLVSIAQAMSRTAQIGLRSHHETSMTAHEGHRTVAKRHIVQGACRHRPEPVGQVNAPWRAVFRHNLSAMRVRVRA
jgi:hypothetical protein